MSVDEKISKTLVNQVCNFYRISDKDLFSKTRKREIVIPRQVFFYLCKKHTKLSLSKIGLISLKYGRKKELDHASVLHGINKIKNTSSTEKSLLKSVELLDKLITPEKDYTQVDFEKELSIIDLKNHYEDIILKMKLEHNIKVNTLKQNNHPIFSELKKLSDSKLELFYENRWIPFKKINKID